MIAQVNYYKVGRAEDIERAGWIKVFLLGWHILVFCRDREFFALDISESSSRESGSTTLPDFQHAQSGAPVKIDKFLRGPSGNRWGQLQYFPIVIDNDNVFVGVTR
jgi:hypothetical protein